MKKGLALAAFVAAHNVFGGGAAPAQAQELESSALSISQQTESIKDYCDRPFTLIGDTNHDDLDVQNTLFSQQMLDDLIACDVNKVFVEKDANSITGALVDLVAQGKITPQEIVEATYGVDDDPATFTATDALREQYLIETQFIYNAAQAGIDIIAFDNQAEAIRLRQEANDLVQSALDTWSPHLSDENREAVEQRFAGTDNENIRQQANMALMDLQEREPEIFMEGWNSFMESGEKHDAAKALRNDDTFLKSEIDRHVGADDKAAVILGSWHFANETGLTSLLGRENVRIVNVGERSGMTEAFFKPDATISPNADVPPTPRSERSAPARSNVHRP